MRRHPLRIRRAPRVAKRPLLARLSDGPRLIATVAIAFAATFAAGLPLVWWAA